MADMITLKECYGNGIRPKRDMAHERTHVREMFNAIPLGPRGAKTLKQVTYPTESPALSMSWPYPQILRDEATVLYLDADEVQTVATGSYPFACTARDVYLSQQVVPNNRFEDATGWTLGAGWTIASGIATATGAISTALTYAGVLTNAKTYLITFTITRSAGTITPTFGTTAGTTRSATGTYTEEVVANNVNFLFATSGFTGTVDNISIVEEAVLSETAAWQMVSFQNLWFATTGGSMLFKIPSNPVDGSARDLIMKADNLAPICVGKHNNALVLGGLQGTRLASTYMAALFNHWRDTQTQNVVTTEDDALDASYIMYSEPSGAEKDLPFYLFLASIGIPSTYEAEQAQGIAFTRVEDKLIGFYRCRGAGSVLHVKQLGNDLIVYGTNGIFRLVRGNDGYSEVMLSDQGIMNRMSVAGDEMEHIFIGSRRDLWILSEGKSLTRLDYSEVISTLSSTLTIATFDPVRRYWWFGDGTTCYCWTGYGLGQSDAVIPSSLFRLTGDDDLFGTAITKSDAQIARIVGPIVNIPNNQTFEISSMDVTCLEADATSWTATADYRLRQSDQFRRPTAQDVTDRGRTFVKKTGKDFRAVLIAPNYKEVDVVEVNMAIGVGKPAISNIMAGTDSVLSETNL